jgi:hypothetical protein
MLCGQRRRGVDPATDEVPQDVEQLGVAQPLAVDIELHQKAR